MRRLILLCGVALCGCGTSTSPVPTANSAPPAKTNVARDEQASATSDDKPATSVAAAAEPKIRKFRFDYRFRVKDLKADEGGDNLVRVWLPCPSSSDCQSVARLEGTAPAELSEQTEARFGNRLLYFETAIPESGGFEVAVPYNVTRHEVLTDRQAKNDPKLDDMQRAFFLAADRLVPTSGKPLELIEQVSLAQSPLKLARQLYDVVDDHVVYKKEGTGWGRGDTNWVCDSGYGNCTDFHSLFISLARSQGLPSRFEIGFSIPTDKKAGPIAGYHCWAWFHLDGQGWIPVDISEADKHPELKEYYFGNLTADRVTFSMGRDLELVPAPAGEPVNFLVYPYIEIGGKPLAKEQMELQFAFEDKE